MKKITLLTIAATKLITGVLNADTQNPNIVVIFADDMGYGDVQVLNPERGKILTPNLDKFAKEGMVFTDAHTSSSVCTPSRYSLMTGRYNWRTRLQSVVTWGYSPPLISRDTLTVGQLLQQSGYTTAMIGKWHLGMNLPTIDGKPHKDKRKLTKSTIDWDSEISDGPRDAGFDYFFGISASLDMAPYAFIENKKFISKVDNSTPSSYAEGFDPEHVLDELAGRSVDYIKAHDGSKPFFLYVPLTSPHTPIVPTPEWKGKSGINIYADFQMQTDAVIGRIVEAVDSSTFRDDTLIIITSDNGCSKAANIPELEAQGHYVSGEFRGSKADLWEGGHRVPFLVRWPSVIRSKSVSNQTICLTDVLATCAEITGIEVPSADGEDSVSFLPALKGEKITSTRKGIVNHSISGHFAYRMGDWKLLLAKGSGGWTQPREKDIYRDAKFPEGQLYNLADDPGETNNLYNAFPEKVQEMLTCLKSDIYNGRSTAGRSLPNDIPNENIKLWKGNASK